MTKEQLAQAMQAFAESGKKVTAVEEGASGIDPMLKHCNCGCRGNYTEHTMRAGEGRFADQY